MVIICSQSFHLNGEEWTTRKPFPATENAMKVRDNPMGPFEFGVQISEQDTWFVYKVSILELQILIYHLIVLYKPSSKLCKKAVLL